MTDTSTIVRAPSTAPGSVITRPLNPGGPTVVRTIGTAGRDGVGAPPGGTADYAVPSSHSGAAMWDNPAVIRARGIVVNDATADNGPTIRALIAAAMFSSHPRSIELPPGDIYFDGLTPVTGGVGLVGAGGSTSLSPNTPGTRLVCKSSSASIEFRGTNGVSRGFMIDGNNVATRPWVRGSFADSLATGKAGASRAFYDVHVTQSAGDGLTIEVAQNDVFEGCGSSSNAGAGIALDWGMGGTKFTRCEVNANTGGSVVIRQSGDQNAVLGSGVGYSVPSHVTFDHCIFERNGTVAGSDVTTISNLVGQRIMFGDCVFTGVGTVVGAVSPVILLAGQSRTTFYGHNKFSNTSSAITTIKMQDTARAWNVGVIDTQNCTGPDLDAPTGTKWLGGGTWNLSTEDKSLLLGSGTSSNGNSNTVETKVMPVRFARQATTDQAFDVKVGTDVGPRLRVFADGKLSLGDGTAFAWDASLWRSAAGALNTDADFTAARLIHGTIVTFTLTNNGSAALHARGDEIIVNLNTKNLTALTVDQHVPGQEFLLTIVQGATPSTASWPTATYSGNAPPTIPAVANAQASVRFRSDGTNLFEIGRSIIGTSAGLVYTDDSRLSDQRALLTVTDWAATTAYVAGQLVLSPIGQYVSGAKTLVQANTSFTSGGSFNTANWTALNSGHMRSRFAATIGPSAASGTFGTAPNIAAANLSATNTSIRVDCDMILDAGTAAGNMNVQVKVNTIQLAGITVLVAQTAGATGLTASIHGRLYVEATGSGGSVTFQGDRVSRTAAGALTTAIDSATSVAVDLSGGLAASLTCTMTSNASNTMRARGIFEQVS